MAEVIFCNARLRDNLLFLSDGVEFFHGKMAFYIWKQLFLNVPAVEKILERPKFSEIRFTDEKKNRQKI